MTRTALGLTDHHANGIIAKQLIELAERGERNPDRLCECALDKLRGGFVRRLARAALLRRSPSQVPGRLAIARFAGSGHQIRWPDASVQNNSGLPQGPAGASAAS